MRRLAVLAAVLLATACASTQKPAEPAQGQGQGGGAASGGRAAPDAASGETLTTYDLNHDGKPDAWVYSVKDASGKDQVVRKEKDLNGDGKTDVWEFYGADGSLSKLVYDMDFDGKPDVTLHYEKDQLVRKEYGFGFDGLPHSFNFYEKGKLVRKERDANGDGKIDYWEYWENGEIDRIGVDVDADGQVDKWELRRSAQPGEAATPATAAAPQK
jgi:hypothetical protein